MRSTPRDESVGLTGLGKLLSFLLVAGLLGLGVYVVMQKMSGTNEGASESPAGTSKGESATPAPAADTAPTLELAATLQTPARLPATSAYVMKGDTVDVELSEYAGYSGLILANGGLEPSENSVFFKKHGFKLKIRLSEEESWPALVSGKMAASATTADVLAVYGRQFDVTVPVQIGFSRGADGIVVRNTIRRINDLKGKVLIIGQFTEADFFIRYLAQEAGIGVVSLPDLSAKPVEDKINLVFAADAIEAGDLFLSDLKSGAQRLAGCVTWEPKTSEIIGKSKGKAVLLASNKNLLIVADVLVVNRPFAQANPKIVAGLVDGILEGNRILREKVRDTHEVIIGDAFKWDRMKVNQELAKVHLSNGKENLAFFSGAIDAAGSFGGIFNSAVLAYGPQIVKDPVDGDRFVDLAHLKAMDAAGAFKDETIAIAPIRSSMGGQGIENNPLLSKDIRFFFVPNSAELDPGNTENAQQVASIRQMLQVSPGSRVLLRGHVDNSLVADFRKRGGEEFVRKMALRAIELSKQRADSVRRLLVETGKLDADRIETVGRGWEEPSGENPDENRRVEVQWFTLE